MDALVMAALGALIGASVLGVIASVLGVPLFPGLGHALSNLLRRSERLGAWMLLALIGGAGVWAWTGWPIAGLWTVVGILAIPLLRGGAGRSANTEIAKVEAIATWTEQIRDTMNASAGLQQALTATAVQGPEPIAPELRVFARRAPRGDLGGALRQLGDDLAHPSADMVVAGLLSATELDAGRLVPLLSRLASSIRDEAQMRVRVEIGRARVRTSMMIVGVFVTLTMLVLLLFAGDLLAGYGSAWGQLWLMVVGAVVVLAVWSSRRLSDLPQPERFVARRGAAA